MKRIIILIISVVVTMVVSECASRLMFSSQLKIPFLFDTRLLVYPHLYTLFRNYNPNDKNVLLLGGSVLLWADDDKAFNTLMNDPTYTFYNVGRPAYSSLDNVYEYSYLLSKGYRFRHVVFYNSINDVRYNNVPSDKYNGLYEHNVYYKLVNRVFQDDIFSRTVLKTAIGFSLYKNFVLLSNTMSHKFIPLDLLTKANPEWMKYGSDIKTATSFYTNIVRIIDLAHNDGSVLIVPKFAFNYPDDYSWEKEKTTRYVKGRSFPVEIWGRPENVLKGLSVHNDMIEKLADKFVYVNTDPISSDSANFSDICHLSDRGRVAFVNQLTSVIKMSSEN